MRKKKSVLVVLILILFVSIGYAYLSSNLSIGGISLVKKTTWKVYFDNLVDDNELSEVNVPASISEDKKSVNFEVTFESPGDEYYFYVDIRNDGTLDAMLDSFEVTGLTEDQAKYIDWSVTYNDGVELNRYDLLESETQDRIKVTVSFKEDISVSDLPSNAETINLAYLSSYVQADENAKMREHIDDVVAPKIQFIKNNIIEGNNNWYKNLSITTKIIDSSEIISSKYCVSDSDCTPNINADLANNTFDYLFKKSDNGKTICVEAVDSADNKSTSCSHDEYKVDGEDPIVTGIEVTPDDDTVLVEVVGNDAISGVEVYYYSKDGGETYVSSKNPNYTFTNLDNGNYIITVYVEDEAGNTSTTSVLPTTVRHKSWCEKNGITNLGDCAIATEAGEVNIEEAKTKIKSKGSPDFSKTSPTYTYKVKMSSGTSAVTVGDNYYDIGTGYGFSNGYFSLNNIKRIKLDEIDFDISQGDYYSFLTSYNEFVKLDSITVINSDNGQKTYRVTKYDLSLDIASYDVSNSGMYEIQDEDGESYYYRGAVGGNYVKLGDTIWKIVRINGNGSIRLMFYSKENQKITNSIEKHSFNKSALDPTHVGFKINEADFSNEILSKYGEFTGMSSNSSYIFSKGYYYDEEEKLFKLDTSSENIISGVYSEIYKNLIKDGYIYTCFSNSTQCSVMKKMTSNYNWKSECDFLYFGSTSYENAVKNVTNSTILNYLYEWYEKNILDKRDSTDNLLTDYLDDEVFCNDRSIVSGDGYSLYPSTKYGGDDRLFTHKRPSLICLQDNDKFKVNSLNEATNLKYPIGLITADEVVLAGAVENKNNELFYMNYHDNKDFWTMTPSVYNSGNIYASLFFGTSSGGFSRYYASNVPRGVRPVINLKNNVKISSGMGTIDDPFVITMDK